MLDEAGGPTAGPYPLVRLYISGTYPLTVATLPASRSAGIAISHYWPIIRARDPYGYCNVISAIDRVGTVYTSPTTSIPPTQCAWALEIDLPLTQPCVCAESPPTGPASGPRTVCDGNNPVLIQNEIHTFLRGLPCASVSGPTGAADGGFDPAPESGSGSGKAKAGLAPREFKNCSYGKKMCP